MLIGAVLTAIFGSTDIEPKSTQSALTKYLKSIWAKFWVNSSFRSLNSDQNKYLAM